MFDSSTSPCNCVRKGPTLPDDLLNLAKIETGLECFKLMMDVVKNATKTPTTYNPEVWMGEGNAAGHGGRPGITNTLENSFWYAHALGTAADLGLGRFLRQTFVGGGYELVNRTTFDPNPDYYVALLWQRLMGTKTLHATLGAAESNVRIHAMCARVGSSTGAATAAATATTATATGYTAAAGDVVVLAINFDQTATITVDVQGFRSSARVHSTTAASSGVGARYTWAVHATDPASAPQGRTTDIALMAANGTWTPLKLTSEGDSVALPRMPPVEITNNPLSLPVQPLSYSFSLLAGAKAPACL